MKEKTSTARIVLGWLLLAACLALAVVSLWLSQDAPPPFYAALHREVQVLPIPVQTGEIAVNKAAAEELKQLPGVGDAIAERILEEKERHGAFFYPEDMLQVWGIGEKKLEKMRTLLDMRED